jgi:hypothetical protein
MLKKLFIGLGILLFVAAILILRPVPIISEDQAIVESGIVSDIYEGGENDVVFRLENQKRRYYINRGLENGLELADLQERLIGREITLKYPDYWTPLDWNDEIKHLSKVEIEGEIVFNELKPS